MPGFFFVAGSGPVTSTTDIAIRPEAPGDDAPIHTLTARAFAAVPYSDGSEPLVIERLRSAGALALSLVAVRGAALVGHVALSPGDAADGTSDWFALGPISVEPVDQGKGIGALLVAAAIAWLRERGAKGCVLVGDPGYYARFGFTVRPSLAPGGQPAEYYQVLRIEPDAADTVVGFHPAFFG